MNRGLKRQRERERGLSVKEIAVRAHYPLRGTGTGELKNRKRRTRESREGEDVDTKWVCGITEERGRGKGTDGKVERDEIEVWTNSCDTLSAIITAPAPCLHIHPHSHDTCSALGHT